MKVEYKTELKSIKGSDASVHIERTMENVFLPHLAPVFVALLQNMKETDKRAFYEAMTYFISEELNDD